MYLDAYNLICEILSDADLKKFVQAKTAKSLVIIDAGPQVTTPCANIEFLGSSIGQIRDRNTAYDADYRVTFEMPFWRRDGMKLAHEFLDKVVETFLCYTGEGGRCIIKRVTPSMMEPDVERKLWTISVTATVLIFL